MKVSLEGTTEEILVLAGILGCSRVSFSSIGVSDRPNVSSQNTDRPGLDDVPNRYREEGVQ